LEKLTAPFNDCSCHHNHVVVVVVVVVLGAAAAAADYIPAV